MRTFICKRCKRIFEYKREKVYCSDKCFRLESKKKIISQAQREIISKANKGRKQSPEHIEKLRQIRLRNPARYWKGKKFTKEHRKKLSEARFGGKRSLESRKKMSVAHKGEKSYNWKGGITPIHKAIRHSFEYKLWRTAVFERDNYTCIWCGDKNYKGRHKSIRLEADHIKPFADYPELRFSIDNGRTLCIKCHKTTNTYGYSLINRRNGNTHERVCNSI